MQEPAVALDTGKHWRRLSPVAMLYFIASGLKTLVQNGLYAIPALAIGSQTSNITAASWFIPALWGIAVVMLGSAVLNYFFYHFRVRENHVEIRSGMFSRRHINLPFWRIQNVKVERPFYYRFTRFAVVILDTAGSAKEEANLVAVTHEYAQTLRTQILASRSEYLNQQQNPNAESQTNPDTSSTHTNEQIINTRSVKDLVIHGVTNNRVWILLGALAPFFDEMASAVNGYLSQYGLQLEQLAGSQAIAWWQWGLYLTTVTLIIMTIMGLLSIGGALLTYYGYTLSKDKDRYIRRSGLLTQQEVSMRESRIQLVSIKQDWLDKLLKRANVFFEQNKSGQQRDQELMAANKLVVPSVTTVQADELAGHAFSHCTPSNQPYKRLPLFYMLHHALVRLLPLSILLMVLAYTLQQVLGVTLVVIGFVLAVVNLALRYRRWGHTTDSQYLYVRSGCIGIDYRTCPLHKVQQVKYLQSVMMRRRKVASVKVVLASGSLTIPFMAEADAKTLINTLLLETESTRRSWM